MTLLFGVATLLWLASADTELRRARQALTDGERASTQAGEACRASDYDKCVALSAEIQKSVETAQEALYATGIDPARNPRHFKDAEIRVRKILRLVDDLRPYIHSEDQTEYDAVRRRVSEINDQMLSAIMSRRKKKK